MKKNNNLLFVAILFLVMLVLLELFVIYKQTVRFESFKSSVPFLVNGESVEYFDLIGMDNSQVSIDSLSNDSLSLVLIFERPCSKCNKSIVFWRKLAGILKGKVSIYGIVLDGGQDAFDLGDEKKLGFKLYSPLDQNLFMEKYRLNMNVAQTIILRGNHVASITIGNLNNNDFRNVVNKIKQILKEDS